MIIARLHLPKTLHPPRRIWDRARQGVEVDVSSTMSHDFSDRMRSVVWPEKVGDRPEWIHCRHGTPHRDESFEGNLFLSLVVHSDGHGFGDARMKSEEDHPVRRGDLLLINPMVRHWLIWYKSWCTAKLSCKPWIALQWTLPPKDVPPMIARLVTGMHAMHAAQMQRASARKLPVAPAPEDRPFDPSDPGAAFCDGPDAARYGTLVDKARVLVCQQAGPTLSCKSSDVAM